MQTFVCTHEHEYTTSPALNLNPQPKASFGGFKLVWLDYISSSQGSQNPRVSVVPGTIHSNLKESYTSIAPPCVGTCLRRAPSYALSSLR